MINFREILKKDPAFKTEVMDLIETGKNLPIAKRNNVNASMLKKAMIGPRNEMPREEAMVQMHLRPSLLIRNNKIEVPDSSEVRKRLMPCIGKLESRVPSVGRIEFQNTEDRYFGTGWMISEDVIVTNRHVARLMASKKGKTIMFRKNAMGETIEACIDFKEEYAGKNVSPPEFEIPIEKVLFMTDNVPKQPDIAFIKIQKHPKMPQPIPISDTPLKKDQFVSVIGYPAFDPGAIISPSAASSVFNNIYKVKRCSPGEIMEYGKNAWYFYHDCTTLGGNSGSVVLDNRTGYAVGLHYMGEVEKENYAVKSTEILKYLKKIKTRVYIKSAPVKKGKEEKAGGPSVEAPPESYGDRNGYQEAFLGKSFKVPMPVVVKNKQNVLKVNVDGTTGSELKYHHFSVVMNKQRRMCFFSICNIDGQQSKRGVARAAWKNDSRIPAKMQIRDECYGNPPKFSRGHMTRKEDPIWGDLKMARAACADTFHVTNATPQMQPFNAPVWLALEDYALENARQDDMRITVITGPVFHSDDPVRYGIKVPVEFFKIIAFIHDETGKLSATGYTVSQADYLAREEFVYGEFKTYQVSIRSLETKTGIDFGRLADVDPAKGEEAISTALMSVEEIVFY
ncbi:MAG TPA: DNA/RNA non-specific endonuclease [Nitrospirota bacterium]|nr:DNA/RNA non-specific endonuclease [Nitrospirota bacterium]